MPFVALTVAPCKGEAMVRTPGYVALLDYRKGDIIIEEECISPCLLARGYLLFISIRNRRLRMIHCRVNWAVNLSQA